MKRFLIALVFVHFAFQACKTSSREAGELALTEEKKMQRASFQYFFAVDSNEGLYRKVEGLQNQENAEGRFPQINYFLAKINEEEGKGVQEGKDNLESLKLKLHFTRLKKLKLLAQNGSFKKMLEEKETIETLGTGEYTFDAFKKEIEANDEMISLFKNIKFYAEEKKRFYDLFNVTGFSKKINDGDQVYFVTRALKDEDGKVEISIVFLKDQSMESIQLLKELHEDRTDELWENKLKNKGIESELLVRYLDTVPVFEKDGNDIIKKLDSVKAMHLKFRRLFQRSGVEE